MPPVLRTALDIFTISVVVILGIPVMTVATQVLGFKRRALPEVSTSRHDSSVRVAVLVPAHNEELTIGEMLKSTSASISEDFRVTVVADNCTDRTADIARGFPGVEVFERNDPDRRGKGYALEHGVAMLRISPPDVVFILDADCQALASDIIRAAERSASSVRPVQLLYEMNVILPTSISQRLAWFAWRFKGYVRAVGAHRLGFPSQLMGSGMAFPWEIIRDAPLGSGEIVEDLKLGIDLAIAGVAPQFSLLGKVTSTFPTSERATDTQRKRWEHGHLGVMKRELPKLLRESLRQRRVDLLLAGLDLCVPPLALLSMLVSAVLVVALAWGLVSGHWSAAGIAALSVLVLVSTILRGWWIAGRGVIGARDIAMVPLYALRKIPLYLEALTGRRETTWKRTDRH